MPRMNAGPSPSLALDNRLVIAGAVCRAPETRYSPAGIPITRFVLEHRSRQQEAGAPRAAYCQMRVYAAGEALQAQAQRLTPGAQVRVQGFLCRADNRRGADALVLHAQHIEPLD